MTTSARPNILLITSDQQHWNTIGKHFPEIHTPNLDRLANRGMLFNRAFCPNPTCTPTRASLITGQFASRHGAWSLGTKLPEDAETIGALLGKAGYDTSLIGKAHFQQLRATPEHPSIESHPLLRDLDYWRNFHGPFYGFEHVELARNHADEAHAGQHYALWMEEKGLADWQRHFENQWGEYSFGDTPNPPQKHHWDLPEQYHPNAWITERVNARMDHAQQAGKPFFIWASFFDPHPPYLAPAPWDTMYDPEKLTVPQLDPDEFAKMPPHLRETQKPDADFSAYQETPHENHGLRSHEHDPRQLAEDIAVYYGMVSLMDKYIGGILDHLESIGQADNTLIVFTSDHGHYYGHHGLVAKGPFHYDDGIRVPCIASWPGVIPENRETNAFLSLVDLPVTFLCAAGLPVSPLMQGVDQLDVLRGQSLAARDHVLVEFRHQPTAIHMKTYVDDTHKITLYFRRDFGELYDRHADPQELNNLWDDPASQTIREALTRKLLFAEMAVEPMPMPRVSVA